MDGPSTCVSSSPNANAHIRAGAALERVSGSGGLSSPGGGAAAHKRFCSGHSGTLSQAPASGPAPGDGMCNQRNDAAKATDSSLATMRQRPVIRLTAAAGTEPNVLLRG